jgi:hypothetical protein
MYPFTLELILKTSYNKSTTWNVHTRAANGFIGTVTESSKVYFRDTLWNHMQRMQVEPAQRMFSEYHLAPQCHECPIPSWLQCKIARLALITDKSYGAGIHSHLQLHTYGMDLGQHFCVRISEALALQVEGAAGHVPTLRPALTTYDLQLST